MAQVTSWLRKYQKWIKLLIPVLIIALVYYQARDIMRSIQPEVAVRLMLKLSIPDRIWLLTVSFVAISFMSGYDFILTRMIGQRFSLFTLWRVGWIANTFNNIMGFAGLTGSGLRLMLYRKRGVSSQLLLPKLIFLSVSMLTGLSVLCLFALFGSAPYRGQFPLLLVGALGMAALLPAFAGVSRIPAISKRLGLVDNVGWAAIGGSIAVSILEWLGAVWVFNTVAGMLHIHIPLVELLGLFGLAAAAGVISMLPGGVGSFDLLMLAGLQTYGINADKALAAILLYRIFYYFIPWLMGLMLAAGEWIIPRPAVAQDLPELFWGKWKTFWNWPGTQKALGGIGNAALAALVFSSGFIMLMSAAIPTILYRSKLLNHWLTLHAMKVSHHLTVLVGLLLIVLSLGIHQQVKRAFYSTLVLLVAGAFFSLAKGMDLEEAFFLGLVFVFLWMSKDRFGRSDIIITHKTLRRLFVVTLCMTLLYIVIGVETLPDSAEWLKRHHIPERYLITEYEHWRSGIIALTITWLSILGFLLLRRGRPGANTPDPLELLALKKWLEKYRGNYVTHLFFLGDKSLFWSKDGQALIAYRRTGRVLTALGDPIGSEGSLRQAVLEFRQYADNHACIPAFYQVRPQYLSMYHDLGFRFFKLGEEGVADVQAFDLSGKSKKDLRAVKNRYERERISFEVLEPPFSRLDLDELRDISDEWLEGRQEKGYSIGWFKESYLQLTGIALLRGPDGRILAFASLMPCYDGDQAISIDLMRYRKETPNGVMDALFLHLLEWSKAQGYHRFNLGMAPLSNVGESAFAHRSERIAHEIYRRANRWYRFAGIRKFKEKFDPAWEPRFLAYPSGSSLPFLMWRITRMISRTPRIKE